MDNELYDHEDELSRTPFSKQHVPLFKKVQISKHRPVSLTRVICNTIIITVNYVPCGGGLPDQHRLIEACQHGFKNSSSCLATLLYLK